MKGGLSFNFDWETVLFFCYFAVPPSLTFAGQRLLLECASGVYFIFHKEKIRFCLQRLVLCFKRDKESMRMVVCVHAAISFSLSPSHTWTDRLVPSRLVLRSHASALWPCLAPFNVLPDTFSSILDGNWVAKLSVTRMRSFTIHVRGFAIRQVPINEYCKSRIFCTH